MSIFTNVAAPTTLADLLLARNEALRLIADARRITEMAKQTLEQHGPYLMPRGAQLLDDAQRVRSELDCSMWRRAFDLTGFKPMDAQAVAEFEMSLSPIAPEFTEANILRRWGTAGRACGVKCAE